MECQESTNVPFTVMRTKFPEGIYGGFITSWDSLNGLIDVHSFTHIVCVAIVKTYGFFSIM